METYRATKVADSGDGKKVCLLCGKAITAVNIRRHFNEVHLESRSQYRCPACRDGPLFDKLRRFQYHLTTRHPDLAFMDTKKCLVKEEHEQGWL